MFMFLAPVCMFGVRGTHHVTVPKLQSAQAVITAMLGSRSTNASVLMSTAWSGARTQEGAGLAADRALVDFNSQYDGKGGRPAAHLVIAWPHGVPSVDAMVEAFHADGNMSVVSLINAEMHNATVILPCLYATETGWLTRDLVSSSHDLRKRAWYGIRHKAVCPLPPLAAPSPSGPGGTQRDLARAIGSFSLRA